MVYDSQEKPGWSGDADQGRRSQVAVEAALRGEEAGVKGGGRYTRVWGCSWSEGLT